METCHLCKELIKNYIGDERVFFDACCARSLVINGTSTRPRLITANASPMSTLTTPNWCPKMRGVLRESFVETTENKLLPPPPTTSQASSEVPFKNLSYYEKMKRLSELPKHMTWDEIKIGNTYVIPKILTKKMKIVKVVEKTAAMIRCSEIEDGKETLYMTTIYPNDVEAVFIVKLLTF